MYKSLVIGIVFLLGLYFISQSNKVETFITDDVTPHKIAENCPDVLIQKGSAIFLYNSKRAGVAGVNPIRFENLDEYTEFVDWQRSQGIKCPLLYLQKSYSTQNEAEYHVKPMPKHLINAVKKDPPYTSGLYPGMDPENQDIGKYTELDKYGAIEQSNTLSKNPMDPNWGGADFTQDLVDKGYYAGNEVNIAIA